MTTSGRKSPSGSTDPSSSKRCSSGPRLESSLNIIHKHGSVPLERGLNTLMQLSKLTPSQGSMPIIYFLSSMSQEEFQTLSWLLQRLDLLPVLKQNLSKQEIQHTLKALSTELVRQSEISGILSRLRVILITLNDRPVSQKTGRDSKSPNTEKTTRGCLSTYLENFLPGP